MQELARLEVGAAALHGLDQHRGDFAGMLADDLQ